MTKLAGYCNGMQYNLDSLHQINFINNIKIQYVLSKKIIPLD